jgi:excisionase family DNA binding protein
MTRRHDCRRVKIHRTYSVPEAAKLLGVHKNTVRQWIKRGLPVIEEKRPLLIHGSDLKNFLKAQQPKKQPCQPGEIYCVRCRAPKRPAGDMVDFLHKGAGRGLLQGICPTCSTLIHRLVTPRSCATLEEIFKVTHRLPQGRVGDTDSPLSNLAFKKDHETS